MLNSLAESIETGFPTLQIRQAQVGTLSVPGMHLSLNKLRLARNYIIYYSLPMVMSSQLGI